MGRIIGIVLIVVAIWFAANYVTRGTASPEEPESVRSTPQRVGDRVQESFQEGAALRERIMLFAAVLAGDPRVETYLYRVLNENLIPGRQATGGLCGAAPTRHMAVSEFVDSSGRWVFKIAAFRGDAPPPANVDPELCGAFAYTAQ